ncbi:MAG TPA: hypothetical protein DIT64_09405 [Verrucomicrobiales bacterium]|nr:hypothetical protein [Verrucomicrobiales bacterium]
MKTLLAILCLFFCVLTAHAQTLPGFSFNTGDNSFTYDDPDDAGAVVTGYIRKPTTAAATGQAILICHGKGGSAANFNSQHAANFVQWGYYCIVPQLSHAGAGGGTSSNEGYCPENSRIGRACLKILADVPTVDMTRVAMFGHSMGAYFTGGFCGENPSPHPALRAAILGAGGSQGTGGSSTNALPTQAEVAGITAPMLLFHGTQDTSYPRSQDLKASLDLHTVPNRLLLYQAVPHGIMDANQKRADVYSIGRAWFTTHGVLSFAGNTAPTISAPASVTVTAGVASSPVAVTIGDGQTAASALTVEAFSLDADVAGTTTPPVPAYSGRLNNSGLAWGGSGANRTLTITPAAGVTGTVEVALVVTDGTASTGQLSTVHYLQVTITSGAPPLTLAYNTGGTRINVNRNATPGSSLTATGGTAPYSWALVSGSLPAGITLNSNGTFSGTSTASGGHTFRARATDTLGATGEADFSLWVNATRQGTVTPITFNGPVTGAPVTFSLYLPPGYSGGSTSYPVIYHLHGIGGTHDGPQITTVPVSHEAAVGAGLIEPCIIVFPDGYGDSFWADAVNVVKPAETNIMQEIIPHLEANYRVRPGGNHRVMQGFSMGGFGAAKFATKFPASFACCAVYDGAMLTWTQMQQRHANQTATIFNNSMAAYNDHSAFHWVVQNAATLRASMPFRDAVGDLVSENQAWKAALDAQSIPSGYVETGLPHSVGPLFDAQGANMWEFIAEALAAGADDFTISFPGGGVELAASTGAALNVTLTASGGTAPYTWSVLSGALPAGVTLSSAGVLSGTPTAAGTFTFTVQVSDSGGGTDTQQLVLTVNAPPAITPQASRDVNGNIVLAWPTTIGAWYQVEVSDDLMNWLPLGAAVAATQAAMSWTDNGTLTGSPPAIEDRRFYRVRDFGVFTVNVSGNNFTYTNAQRSVTGILRKPAGDGPFPAVVINHGTGGSAGGYAGARATEMLPWGLVCIGADLTHQDTGAPEAETGHSPENHARIEACLAVLASRGYVDMNRVVMFGNSRGGFTTAGSASLLHSRIKAIGICAGGVLEDGDGSDVSYPSVSEASGITAPALIFHGSNDTVVPPANSLRLQNLLSDLGVTNSRILHATTGTASHNLHQDATVWPQVLGAWQAWLVTHGVVP